MDQVLSQDKVMVKPEGGDMLEVSRDSSGAITKRDTVHQSKRQRRRHAWH